MAINNFPLLANLSGD